MPAPDIGNIPPGPGRPVDQRTLTTNVQLIDLDLTKLPPAAIYTCEFKGLVAGAANGFSIRPNALTTNLSRIVERHSRGGASVGLADAANSQVFLAPVATATEFLLKFTVHAETGYRRMIEGDCWIFDAHAVNLLNDWWHFTITWNDTSTALTTIRLFSDDSATGLDINSRGRAWATYGQP